MTATEQPIESEQQSRHEVHTEERSETADIADEVRSETIDTERQGANQQNVLEEKVRSHY